MSDARIVIDADAHKVVMESRKAKAAVQDLADATTKASGETGRATVATDRWARAQAAGAAAGRRQAQTMHELGTAARRSTLALGALAAAGLADVIKTGAGFEAQMSRVKAVTNATGGQMKTLNALAMQLGRDTKFSAGQAAEAMYELSSAGFKVSEMTGAMKGTLALAAASNVELADAAEISANALRGFGLASNKATHVADVMATAVNASSVEMGDLQLSMKYIGPIARSTGQSFEQMTAALEIMGDAGIKGEQAGTSLRGGLLRLVKPTKMVVTGMDSIGLKTSELVGPKGLRPLSEIIGILHDKTDGLSKAQRNTALAQIFGTEALSGMLALVDEGAGKLDRYTRANERADGAASKAAKTMQDNVSGAWEQLHGSIETVEIALFQQFQKPLHDALMAATQEVNTKGKVVEKFFARVFEMPEFKAADLGGKLQILLDELDKTGLPHRMRDLIVQGFVDALNAAVPVVIAGAGHLAVEGAKAFGKAFIDADPLSRVLLTGYLLHKTGALAAFRAYGKTAGAEVAGGAAVGATTGAGAAGWKTAAKGMGRQFGLAAAVMAGIVYAPEFAKQVKGGLSSSGDLGLPKSRTLNLVPNLGLGDTAQKALDLTPLRDVKSIGSTLTSVMHLFGDIDPKLRDFSAHAAQAFKTLSAAHDTAGLSHLSDDARKMAQEFPQASSALLHFADIAGRAAGTVTDQFSLMRRAGGKSLHEISQVAADTEFEINQRLGRGSTRAKDALSRNFMLAAQAIRKSMDDGKISTRTGMREIEELFVKALSAYGFTRAEAINRAHGKEFSGKSSPGGTTHTNAARGGLMQVGKPGGAGHDNVPALLNGQKAMVADGEQIAVFNRHQQAALNARLADQGGLAGFFASNRKPHYLASGGMIGKANRLDQMHLPYKWGGGHGSSTGFDASGMDCSATVSYILGIPPRTSGDLMGYGRPGPGPVTIYANPSHTFMSLKGRGFGTSGENPGGGPGWLTYSARGGFDVSHVGLGVADKMRRVRMQVGLGAVSTLGQRALDVTQSAAQQRLDGLSAPGMDTGAISGAPNAGDWHAALADIASERGWSRADWEWIVARESGGSITAKNPKSSAYGLGQLVDSNYRRLGGGPGSGGSEQIRAMAAYIAERYGTPTAARAHWQQFHSYATGGFASGGSAQQPAKGKKRPSKRKALTLNQVKKKLGQRLKQGYPITEIDRMEDLVGDNGTVERLKKTLDQTRQLHELTDEEKTRTLPDGSEVLNPDGYKDDRGHWIGGIKAHVAEDMTELASAGMIYGGYDQAINGLPHLQKQIDEGITERNERVKLIARLAVLEVKRRKDLEASIKRLQRRKITTAASRRAAVNDAADSADADKGAIRDQIANLQAQKRTATSSADRKSLDDQITGKRGQIEAISHRMTTLRRKGGDSSAIALHTLALRDDLAGVKGSLEHWVGTSSNDAGQVDAWQARSVGGDLRNDLSDRWKPAKERLSGLAFDLPDQRFAAFMDVASIRKDLEDWRDTPAPKASDLAASADASSGKDTQLADLLRAQLEDERKRTAMLSAQFSVFQAFAPLVQGRMLGSFARGLARVPETGLAMLHKDETVIPDPAGPFGTRTGGAPGPVNVILRLDGTLAPIVNRMRAEIDGRAARVVSEQLGRNARLIVSARGG